MSDWGSDSDTPVVKKPAFKAESDDGWGSEDEAPVVKNTGFKAASESDSEDDWEKEAELADARAKAEAAKAEHAAKAAAEKERMDAAVAGMMDDFNDSPMFFDNPLKATSAKVQKAAPVANAADFWETLKFTRQADLESFATKTIPKIKETSVNSMGVYKFALMLLPELCAKMDQKDIGNLQKKLEEEFKKKNVQKGAVRDMKKKPNDRVNADDEMDIHYGAVEGDYSDYDEDDYDEDY